jgi:predicted PurR-regulated permease PerM
VVVILGPLGGMTALAVKEAGAGYRYVTETVRSEGMSGLIARLPDRLEAPVRSAIDRFSTDEGADAQIQSQSANAAKAVTGAAAATGKFLLHSALMLIALYFLLLDGGKLIAWLEKHAPLKPGQTYELMLEFRKVSVAVITSSVVTAAVQTAVATIGYLIARVPYALFFAGVTFFVALIPAIGAAAVCVVAALLLLATGHATAEIFLGIWGVVVDGLVDNIVKPILAKRGLQMHGAIVFFALLGGIAAFGPVGLLLGPMVVSFFLALVKIHERDYQRRLPPDERDEPVEAPRVELARKADALDDEDQVPQPS